MDPITAIISGVGFATSLFGASEASKAQEEAARAQIRTNKDLALIASQSTSAQKEGIRAQTKFNQTQTSISRQQENLRKQVMELSARRSFREIVRQNQVARAGALTAAVNQGVGTQSSAVGGAYGQIQGETGVASNNVFQDLTAGRKNFQLNKNLFTAQSTYASAQSRINQTLATLEGRSATVQATGNAAAAGAQANAQFGQGLFNFGQSLISNAPTIKAVGTTAFGNLL